MPLVRRIDTIFVPAPDTRQAARWYARLFGMTKVFESDGYIGLRFEEEDRGETAITLYPTEEIDREAHYAFNFATDNANALHEQLTEDGREVTAIEISGRMRYFDFRDISGNWVNVCET
ncbi:VOC family protein [Henriciella aquimarina]|uniref:VOC family protein n=1 Tax=Henriciella aquimarina TaxID=545261 RepID=UPI0009FCEA25|nr:VOC family protein [Henriciella aquimarina]